MHSWPGRSRRSLRAFRRFFLRGASPMFSWLLLTLLCWVSIETVSVPRDRVSDDTCTPLCTWSCWSSVMLAASVCVSASRNPGGVIGCNGDSTSGRSQWYVGDTRCSAPASLSHKKISGERVNSRTGRLSVSSRHGSKLTPRPGSAGVCTPGSSGRCWSRSVAGLVPGHRVPQACSSR